ncbi:hypothetical protein BH18ACI5_BH18ACI5_09050 [soil metagenome]
MKDTYRAPSTLLTAAIVTAITLGGVDDARAQHVTAAIAASLSMAGRPAAVGCEERAREANQRLEALDAVMERARRSSNEAEMRAATDEAQKVFAELKGRLDACRAAAPAPATSQTPGMDHSKMNMGDAPVASAGAAALPTTVRRIDSPAEEALQSFQDALQIGNREVALRWLAGDATLSEWGSKALSRDAYANEHMALDMTFLKTAKVVLLDRQVNPGADSAHIVSMSRITGRDGEIPVDATVREDAVVKKTPQGWRVASLKWTIEPAIASARPTAPPSAGARR